MEEVRGWLSTSVGGDEKFFSTFQQNLEHWENALQNFISYIMKTSYTSLIHSKVQFHL